MIWIRRTLSLVLAAMAAAPIGVSAQSPAGGTSATVVVTKVIGKSLDRPLAMPGDLVAFQDVELRARISGFVDAVNVDRGSSVRKGELLVRIVAPELASQRAEADARIQSARSQRIEAEAKLAGDEATYQRLQAASKTAGVVAGNDLVVAEKAILDLRGPVLRVTGFDVPYPYWSIEDAYMPSVDRVVAAARRLLDEF